jgi:hypothetical protein
VAAYGHAFSFMLCGGAEGAAVDWATEVGLANADMSSPGGRSWRA